MRMVESIQNEVYNFAEVGYTTTASLFSIFDE
jgi:hypothetical protein